MRSLAIKGDCETEASVAVRISEEDAGIAEVARQAMEALVRKYDRMGYDGARADLERTGNDFIAAVLAGFHADGNDARELLPTFEVLMTLMAFAKEALDRKASKDEDGDEGEYRIVEGERCPSPRATGAEGSSSPP